MALLNKSIRATVSLGTPIFTSKLRYQSECGGDGETPPCILTPCGGGNPNDPTIYDARKYGHCLPSNTSCPCFETLPCMPTGIFRNTTGEVLGSGAGKHCCYLNPEYFSYQHMTFYDIHLCLRKFRLPCPDSKRKPP